MAPLGRNELKKNSQLLSKTSFYEAAAIFASFTELTYWPPADA